MTMFPIKCLVEALDDDQCPNCCKNGSSMVVSDSYAIVAGQTPLSQLADTVLAALGLQHLSYGSKATLQLKHWKPLTFDQITEDQDTEIENILKDVSNHLTLRILTKQPTTVLRDGMSDFKDRLLWTLLQKLPEILSETQQHQLKDVLAQLPNGDLGAVQNGFAAAMMQFPPPPLGKFPHWAPTSTHSLAEMFAVVGKNGSSSSSSETAVDLRAQPLANNLAQSDCSKINGDGAGRFSALYEVPKLEHWYRENANPSRQKLQHYMNQLNTMTYRRHNPKVTYQQICNWFINSRAARKRNHRLPMGVNMKPINFLRHKPSLANAFNGSIQPWRIGDQIFNANGSKNLSDFHFLNNGSTTTTNNGPTVESSTNNNSCPLPTTSPVQSLQPENMVDQITTEVDMNGPAPNIDAFLLSDASLISNNVDTSASPSPQGLEIDDKGHSCSSRSSIHDPDGQQGDQKLVIAENSSKNFYDQHSNEFLLGSQEDKSVHVSSVTSTSPSGQNNLLDHQQTALSPSSAKLACAQINNSTGNRSRLMFDPLSELPMLERWFDENPHPSWVQIDQITDTLNGMSYRHTYPRVSSHNVKIWFKNRRAKCKRSMVVSDPINGLII